MILTGLSQVEDDLRAPSGPALPHIHPVVRGRLDLILARVRPVGVPFHHGLDAAGAEDAIAAMEAFYRSVNMPLHLRDAGISEADAADRVLAGLRAHGKMALGGHAGIDEAKTERIVRAACA